MMSLRHPLFFNSQKYMCGTKWKFREWFWVNSGFTFFMVKLSFEFINCRVKTRNCRAKYILPPWSNCYVLLNLLKTHIVIPNLVPLIYFCAKVLAQLHRDASYPMIGCKIDRLFELQLSWQFIRKDLLTHIYR